METNQKNIASLDNGQFMHLWASYSRCQGQTDLETLKLEADRLNATIQDLKDDGGFALSLPRQFEQLVSRPAPRLAVDLKAMAAACSLSAGQVALSQGKNDVARELFQTVIANNSQQEYSYYLVIAKAKLSEIEVGLQAALVSP